MGPGRSHGSVLIRVLKVMFETTFDSPLGPVRLAAEDGALCVLRFGAAGQAPFPASEPDPATATVLAQARGQLEAYFAGERTAFDLPLAPRGTDFDRRVWAAVSAIGHGETASYGELAARIGAPTAARAVGHANGRNPIAVIIPCHRVVGASGALTGYAYGVERKAALLELERA